jgi:hypothetical protein
MKGVRVSHLKKDLMVFDESEFSLLSSNVNVSKFASIIGFAAFGLGVVIMMIEGLAGTFPSSLSVALVFLGLVLLVAGIVLYKNNNPRFEQQNGLKQTIDGLLDSLSYEGAIESIGQPLHFGNRYNGLLLAFHQEDGWVLQEYNPGSSVETAPDFECYVDRFRVTKPDSVYETLPYSVETIVKLDSMVKIITSEVGFRNAFQAPLPHRSDLLDVDEVLT